MIIKPRTRYKTGRGTIESIHSETRLYPEYMWSLGGDWYAKEDGRFIHYIKDYDDRGKCIGGHHERNTMPTGLDLVEEFTDYDYDKYWELIT